MSEAARRTPLAVPSLRTISGRNAPHSASPVACNPDLPPAGGAVTVLRSSRGFVKSFRGLFKSGAHGCADGACDPDRARDRGQRVVPVEDRVTRVRTRHQAGCCLTPTAGAYGRCQGPDILPLSAK